MPLANQSPDIDADVTISSSPRNKGGSALVPVAASVSRLATERVRQQLYLLLMALLAAILAQIHEAVFPTKADSHEHCSRLTRPVERDHSGDGGEGH